MHLYIRPVHRSAGGNWITGQLRWQSFFAGYNRAGFEDAHWDWMSTVAAVRARSAGSGHGPGDSIRVDNFRSPLLWDLLVRGREAGVQFVTAGSGKVRLHKNADISLNVQANGGGLLLQPLVEVDGNALDPTSIGLIGSPTHGIFWWHPEGADAPLSDRNIGLAPTSAPIPETFRLLVTARSPLQIPETGREAFFRDYYPQLHQQVNLISRDGSVELPEIPPPSLLLEISYAPTAPGSRRRASDSPAHTEAVRLSWSWEYTQGGTTTAYPLPEDGTGHRDRSAEAGTLATVAGLLDGFREAWYDAFPRPADGFPGRPEPRELHGVAAARFVAEFVPQLEALEHVRVLQSEDVPDYTELTEQPTVP
ncbi:hypothetical protein ASH00_15595 [Arthrobacter sp. Soil782]|nr:hypothetical protein ASH00_15595 [Arthrobacter sp. Soil782]